MNMLSFLVLLTACQTEQPIEYCSSPTKSLYDPANSDELLAFPDDFLTKSDPHSPTGRYLDLSPSNAPWTVELPAIFQPVVEDSSTRSGFARLGQVVMRFSEAIEQGPEDPELSVNNEGIVWLDLSVDPPERISYSTKRGERADQLVITPVTPLRPNAEHVVLLTNAHKDSMGQCIEPAPVLKQLLNGTADPPYDSLNQRYLDALERSGYQAQEISHALVFTTHNDLHTLYDVAEDITAQTYDWIEPPICDDNDPSYCTGQFRAFDYRSNGSIETAEPQDQWDLTVHLWLPKSERPIHSLAVYGHGINNRAERGEELSNIVSSLGIGVAAVDALHHGTHPTADPNNALPALIFLGIDLSSVAFDTNSLRGSFDQSSADRLQMLQLLQQNPDIDEDGQPDITIDNLFYYGNSLGSLMGPQLLALEGDIQAGVLAVGGGNLPVFTTETEVMQSMQGLLEALVGPPDDFDRLVPVMQAMVDASDPAIWGYHTMQQRYDEAPVPDLLFPVAVNDTDVPPAAAKSLAHGLGIPHLAPAPDPVPMLPVVEGPLHANLSNGATAAYFQFDRVTQGDSVVPVDHSNLPNSPEGQWMTHHFFESHLNGQTEIADPYTALDTAPLP